MKILKKSLAIFLTLALCLSAMLGCLSVSAAEGDPALTLVVENKTYAPDEEFNVVLRATNFAAVQGATFDVNFGTLTVLEVVDSDFAEEIVPDNDQDPPNINVVDEHNVRFVETFAGIAEGNLLVVKVKAKEATTATITVSNVVLGLNSTDKIDLDDVTATVKVEKACTHEKTTTSEEVTASATCTTAGSKIVTVTCEDCKEVVSTTTEEIPALGHGETTTTEETVKDPTCTEGGKKVITETCKVCDQVVSTKEEDLDAAGHGKTTTSEKVVDATCTTAGSKTTTETCDVCGEVVSTKTETIPATGHTEGELVSATPATAVDGSKDGKLTYKCSVCGEEYDKTVSYYMYYQFSLNTLSFESEILVNFKVLDWALNNKGYDDIMVKIGLTGEEIFLGKDAMTTTALSGQAGKQWSFGLKATEYTQNVNCTIFALKDGEWYCGPTYVTTVANSAQDIMTGANTKSSEKKVLANLLNYGEKAQLNFGQYTDNLPTAVMTDTEKAYINTGSATFADTHQNNFNANVEKAIVAECSLSCDSKITFRYTIAVAKNIALENVVAKVNFINAKGIEVPTTITSDKFIPYTSNNTHNFYKVDFTNLAAADLRCDMTLNVYNGEDLISCDVIYSVESLVAIVSAKNITDAEKAMFNALLHYGDAADEHFNGTAQ